MSISSNIRKILIICFWCLAGTGVIVLMVAAVNSRNHKTCNGYEIRINGEAKGKWFIDKEDIVGILTNNKTVSLKNKSLETFDLHKVEAKLESEAWIKDAELFFDNNRILQVRVIQREPVARIFTVGGNSFYIDSNSVRLPLSDKMSAKLPVFTGFPSEAGKLNAADRTLIGNIRRLSQYLLSEPFWMAQIAQIDITPSRQLEMIPTIGNHIIEFGDATDCEKKFHRLMVFYNQALSKSGMDKYERIKVQYDNQVIGVKRETKKI